MEVQPPRTEAQKLRADLLEILAAIILSIAALLTSWASFQSALWEGREAAEYSRAAIVRVHASTAALAAHSRRAVDVGLFMGWLNAKASGNERLAEFYRVRFPPELSGPFEAWLKTDPFGDPKAPKSPFDNGRVRPHDEAEARELGAESEKAFQAGVAANTIADSFQQASVILAITLFFAGIAQVFRMRGLRLVLLAVALLACIVGVVRMTTLPELRLD
jgi:hypothetical protein